MAKYSISKKAVCPYYKGDGKQEIFCEGLIRDSNIHQGFANPAMLEAHKLQYCESSNYPECRIAQMLSRKYEEEENARLQEVRQSKGYSGKGVVAI